MRPPAGPAPWPARRGADAAHDGQPQQPGKRHRHAQAVPQQARIVRPPVVPARACGGNHQPHKEQRCRGAGGQAQPQGAQAAQPHQPPHSRHSKRQVAEHIQRAGQAPPATLVGKVVLVGTGGQVGPHTATASSTMAAMRNPHSARCSAGQRRVDEGKEWTAFMARAPFRAATQDGTQCAKAHGFPPQKVARRATQSTSGIHNRYPIATTEEPPMSTTADLVAALKKN